MKKMILAILFIGLFAFTGCSSNNKNSSNTNSEFDGGVYMNIIDGKIIEIKSDNLVLLEITKERGGYKKDDKVLVSFNEYVSVDGNDPDGKSTVIIPVLNDEVGLQFWPDEVSQKNGYDLITVAQITKR